MALDDYLNVFLMYIYKFIRFETAVPYDLQVVAYFINKIIIIVFESVSVCVWIILYNRGVSTKYMCLVLGLQSP